MEDQNKRAGAWTHEETVLLIELWGTKEYKINRKTHQDKSRICTDMKDRILDFGRSPQDCRGRIERLKTKYFQVKRKNKKSGGKRTSFPYHERMGTILETRPSVIPVALSDSLNSQDDESDMENDPNETIGDTKDEDDTSDMSRQPESQPRSETPGQSRPGTPGSSRPGSTAMQTSRGTRMKTTKRKKEDPAEIMQQFLEMEKTSEKKFLEFDEKHLKLETEQEEKRRKEEADREDRQRNADRQFMANLMQMQMNIMRMQQAPPLPINLSHPYQPHYTTQTPPPPLQINASPLNQQHYTEMQPMQASNMGNYQTADVLKNVRNQMEF